MRLVGDPAQPYAAQIDIPYDRQAAMDEVLDHMLHNRPVDYGYMADINCPVPRTIMDAFRYKSWDWSLAVWMYAGGSIIPHQDMGTNVDSNGIRVAENDKARTAALWFPLYGDYDRTPLGIHEPINPDTRDGVRVVTNLWLDRTLLVDMGDHYWHSMDNRHGHCMWYCLNFNHPETLLGAMARIRDSLVGWSGRRDSNPRPPVPQTGALTRLSHAPMLLMPDGRKTADR